SWLPYLLNKFKKVLDSINFLTTLSMETTSKRFYDRDRALSIGIDVKELLNTAHHESKNYIEYNDRLNQCIVIGYFSHIKNQLELINFIESFPKEIKIKFIGKCEGNYFNKCVKKVKQKTLQNRVEFIDSHGFDIQKELSRSKFLILCSITEALPITLLESMSAGTPFISTNVGSAKSLPGGLIVNRVNQISKIIKRIYYDRSLWKNLSDAGMQEYKLKYSKKIISNKFELLIDAILKR
ncbi:MAG: glycosyltransferase, partial [Gammaproteobacteria bacterium]